MKSSSIKLWDKLNSRTVVQRLFVVLSVSILVIYLVMLPFRLTHGTVSGHLLGGDPVQYYVYLRSFFFDGDLDFTNEYAFYKAIAPQVISEHTTPTGLQPNEFSVGPAILWSPFFLLAFTVLKIASTLGSYMGPNNGYDIWYEIAISIGGLVYGLLGLYVNWRMLLKLFAIRWATMGAVVLWLGSSAVYYTAVIPTYAHSASHFAVSCMLYVWVNLYQLRKDSTQSQRLSQWMLLGVAGGVVALVRWQEGPFLAIILLALVVRYWIRGALTRVHIIGIILSSIAAFITFMPQLYAWQILYGNWFTIPQGENFLRWGDPEVWQMLLSQNGLFLWTPIVAVSLAGCYPLGRRDFVLSAVIFVAFCFQLYLNSIVVDWWAGASFGNRRFVGTLPFLSISLAELFVWLQGKNTAVQTLLIISLVFVLTNILLILNSLIDVL